MSNSSKGNQYENEVKAILEADGWHVEGQHRMARYLPDWAALKKGIKNAPRRLVMQGRDVFGSDLIAKKKGEKTRWIQVGVRDMRMAKIRQIWYATSAWNLEHDIVEVWVRTFGTREFEVYRAPDFASIGVFQVPKKVKDEPETTIVG